MATSASQTFVIENELGLHARAATLLVQTANRYEAEVEVEKDGTRVNGKSIMGVLMLVAAKGTQISVHAEGPDAEEAVVAIAALIENKFNEER